MRSDERTWLLLNDTRFENHLGCSLVVNCIEKEMYARKFTKIGQANSESDWSKLHLKKPPTIVVLNGEGTLHHNSSRGLELLRIAIQLKSRGSKVALINSVWEHNGNEYEDLAAEFDHVYLRESLSQAQMKSRIAEVCPDLVFSYSYEELLDMIRFYPLQRVWKSLSNRKSPMVSDCVRTDSNEMLGEFASRYSGHMYYMGSQADHEKISQKFRLSVSNLKLQDLLTPCDVFVTGRFHAVCLAIIFKKRIVALSSNTHKIQGTIKDLGYDSLIPVLAPGEHRLAKLVDAYEETRLKKPIEFCSMSAKQLISQMFDKISAL